MYVTVSSCVMTQNFNTEMNLEKLIPVTAVFPTKLLFGLQTEKKFKTTEDEHHLSQRWFPVCVEYKLVKENLTTKIRTDLLHKIEDLAREHWVLLHLKAKYAGNYALV